MNKKTGVVIGMMMLVGVYVLPVEAGKKDIAYATGEFMKIPQGARVVGMGGAFVGIADDITASYWNPAGLIQLNGKEVLFNHTSWFEDINSEYLCYSQPIKPINNRKRAMAGSLNLMNVGEIEGRNSAGDKTGSLEVTNLSLSLSLAFELSKQTFLGVNLKGIKQDYGGYKGSGIGLDLGLLTHFNDALSLGLCLQNAGPKIKTDKAKNSLPLILKTGLGYQTAWLGEKSIIGLDLEIAKDNDLNFHTGLEYWVTGMLAIRLGYERQTGFSSGLGLKSQGEGVFKNILVQADYAFLSYSEPGIENTHRVSIRTKF